MRRGIDPFSRDLDGFRTGKDYQYLIKIANKRLFPTPEPVAGKLGMAGKNLLDDAGTALGLVEHNAVTY